MTRGHGARVRGISGPPPPRRLMDEPSEWRAELHAFGTAMCRAYAVGDEVLEWWFDRLPPFR